MASARGRRDALRLAAAAAAAAVFGVRAGGEAEAGVPIYHCRVPGEFCSRGQNCCSGKCDQGICTCSKKGARCYEPLEGSLCCSGRCKKGRCK